MHISSTVRSTTARTWSGPTVGGRPGRGRSRSKPSTPSAANRSCHRHTARLDLPIWRTIAIVPTPAADSSTIRARHTYFCFILGAATMASKCARASAVTMIFDSFSTLTIWVAQPRIGTLLHGQDTRRATQPDLSSRQSDGEWCLDLGRVPITDGPDFL